jgi:hypothetical protein
MRRKNGGDNQHHTSSGKSPGLSGGRDSSGTPGKKGSGTNGRKSPRKRRTHRRFGDRSSGSILQSATSRSAGEMGERITLPSTTEVKEIAKNLPSPWGNHRFLLIMVVLGMILFTVATGLLRSYITERTTPAWMEERKAEHMEMLQILKAVQEDCKRKE